VWAIAVKEFLQLRRDRRTVAMLLLLPFVFLIVFGYAANFDVKSVRAVVVGPFAAQATAVLPKVFDVVATRPADGRAQAVDSLRRGEAVVAIVTPSSLRGKPQLLVDGTEFFAARAAQVAVASASSTSATGRLVGSVKPQILFNPELRTSVIMIPGLLGLILVFIGTIATALGVVRERQAGTMEQLAVMPFRPRDVFLGKIAPYLLLAAVDMAVVVAAGLLVFNVPFRGSVLAFALGAVLFLFVTLGIGVLISTVSQTQGQAIQLAMMTLLPQILLSGFIFPLYSIAAGIRWIGYVLPLTYFVRIARGIMVRGAPVSSLWFSFLMLAILGTLVFSLSVLRFRRDLAPAGRSRIAPAVGGGDATPPRPNASAEAAS
jgi:ABC-2 type transport system permease protein